MRERERLEDFQGGLVACRGCKRLLHFPPDPVTPLLCCGLAYVPTRHQVDLIIYDRIQPGEVGGADEVPAPELEPVPDEDEGVEPEGLPEPTPQEERELESLAATAAEIAERSPARQVALKQRTATGQFVKARG